jgi:hypothetical protein
MGKEGWVLNSRTVGARSLRWQQQPEMILTVAEYNVGLCNLVKLGRGVMVAVAIRVELKRKFAVAAKGKRGR